MLQQLQEQNPHNRFNIGLYDDFDSKLLQKSVLKIDLSHEKECVDSTFLKEQLLSIKEDIVFCIAPCNTSYISILESLNYSLISTLVEFERDSKNDVSDELIHADYAIISGQDYALDKDSARLHELVWSLAQVSHYGKDLKIDKNRVYDLYMQWVVNTWHGYASKLLVAVDLLGNIVAFVSLKEVQNSFRIDLLAVHASTRNRGIAQSLINKVCLYAQEQKKNLCVRTQAENRAAIRLYEKNGFIQKSFNLMYHKIKE